MKATLEQILGANQSLQKITSKELPAKLSYRLSRLEAKLSGFVKSFDKARNELIKKYGTEDAEKKTTSVGADNLPKFQEELLGLLGTVEDVDFEPIKIDMFEGEFSKEFFVLMGKFITE